MSASAFGLAGALLAALALLLAVAAVLALWRRPRPVLALTQLLGAALLLSLAAVAGLLAVGVHGYRSLTHEEVAARITVQPRGGQRFEATFRFPDGLAASYELAGDEIYIDARILKWRPWANLLGLHTGYELSRVAGRYALLEQERSAPRTVHALAPERAVDLFALRRRYARLAMLVDAEYGSATFVPAGEAKELELRVSTTGLLLREVPPRGAGR